MKLERLSPVLLVFLLLAGCAGDAPSRSTTASAAPCAKPLGGTRQRVQTGNLLYTVTEDFFGSHKPITPTSNFQTTAEYDAEVRTGCQ